MPYPSYSTQRSYGGSCTPSYLLTTLSGTYSAGQTFTVQSANDWYEIDSTGKVTSNPLGTSGPFTVVVDAGLATEEKVLCSGAVNRSTGLVTVWSDGVNNGRAYDGTAISSHSAGSSSNLNVYPAATAIENQQFNAGVIQALTVASGAVPLSTVTASGDLIVGSGSGAVSRLAIGTVGQSLVSNGTTATWGQPAVPMPSANGLKAWTFDPCAASNGVALTAGVGYYMMIWIPAGTVVSNIWVVVSTNATTTANSYVALYGTDGKTQLAVSSVITTTWNTAGAYSHAVGPYTVTTGGYYYIGILWGSTSTGSLAMMRSANVGTQYGNLNLTATSATLTGRAQSLGTSLTALPSPIATGTPSFSQNLIWTGVS